MKTLFLLLFTSILFIKVSGQEAAYDFQELKLNKTMASPTQEFSGLYIFKDNLYLLPENDIKNISGLFIMKVSDLEKQAADKNRVAKTRSLKFSNLDLMIKKINQRNQGYDGLEALTVTDKEIYFSVETVEDTCYLIKGSIKESTIVMDTKFLIGLLKPKRQNGARTCNAGFEGMEFSGSNLLCFFEFNDLYTASVAVVNILNGETSWKPLARLAFRLTDVTWTANNKLTAINYFYAGGGCDTIYQPEKHSADYRLATDNEYKFKNLCRLIELEQTETGFNWNPVFNFPAPYHLFNWEGIAAYKESYFLINDRYTGGEQGSHLYLLRPKK